MLHDPLRVGNHHDLPLFQWAESRQRNQILKKRHHRLIQRCNISPAMAAAIANNLPFDHDS